MDIHGKTALVTGGGVRIGKALVEALAEAGAAVIIHYRNSGQESRQLADAIRRRGGQAWTLRADLCSERACRELIRKAAAKNGRLDILVNNAAVFHKDPLARVTTDNLLREFRTNLIAPTILLQEFAKVTRRGKIINMLDRRIAGLDTTCVPYLLSKKNLAELTRIAAMALAPRITVNGVAPGAILPPPGKGKHYLRDKAGVVPLHRQCTPRDVARAVISLLENDAQTGQIVFVDGGQHLALP